MTFFIAKIIKRNLNLFMILQ